MFFCRFFLPILMGVIVFPVQQVWAAPDYISAKPQELTEAYGDDVAKVAFSDNLTTTRKQRLEETTRLSPDLKCSETPPFNLYDLYPTKIDQVEIAWIERYQVDCNKKVRRSLLMIMTGGKVQSIPMAPGNTLSDIILQADAGTIVRTTIAARHASGCKSLTIVDTQVLEQPKSEEDNDWKELWAVYACGKYYQARVLFAYIPGSGTTITVKESGPLGGVSGAK